MVKFRSKNDLKTLYEIQDDGQELKGIIYSPDEDESEDLVLVFEKHTVTITEEGVARVEKRYKTVTEAGGRGMTWAQDRLKELDELIAMNKRLREKYPDSFGLKLTYESNIRHREELLKKIKAGE